MKRYETPKAEIISFTPEEELMRSGRIPESPIIPIKPNNQPISIF